MNRFQYIAPRNFAKALELLNLHRGKVKILAGGTDLIPQIKEDRLSPEILLDLKNIKDLYGVARQDSSLVLGALNPLEPLAHFPLLKEEIPYFVDAILRLGSYQIRCRGTLGGNLCNASPAADCAPILLALGASLALQSVEGVRTVPLENFFLGPGKTSLQENEILTHVHVPLPEEKTYGVYLKHTVRRAMDLAIVSIGALVKFSQKGDCQEARIALGAVAPIPMRAFDLETMLEGKRITPELIKRAREAAMKIISPISDLRASMEYRREMTGVFLERALKILVEQEERRKDG